MRRLALAALTVASALAVPRPAHADGFYFTEAFGGTRFRNDLGRYTAGGLNIHAALGYRARNVSVELGMNGDLNMAVDEGSGPSPASWGIDVKRAWRVSPHVEVYLRGSASHMEIDTSEYSLAGFNGRGLGVGAGVQLKGKAPLLTLLYPPVALICLIPNVCKKLGPQATVALYVDQGYDFYRLHGTDANGARASVDVDATRFRVGFAIGTDF